MNGEVGYIYYQHSFLTFSSNGQVISSPDSATFGNNKYWQATFKAEYYVPISKKFTFTSLLQTGVILDSNQNFFNSFFIGGLNSQYRNQIIFSGLPDFGSYSSSVSAMQLGLRYKAFNSIYLLLRSDALIKNFLDKSLKFQNPQLLTGQALTFAYATLFGNIELSGMYCEQSKGFNAYVDIGTSF